MLTPEQILDKLYEQPEIFKSHMRGKRYSQAKACYDDARNIALFVELDEKQLRELFGERGDRGIIIRQGLFVEEQVQKAYLECIRAGDTYEQKEYEHLQKNSA